MSLRGYRTKLYILLPFAWLLGFVLALDAAAARSRPGSKFASGMVVARQLQANQWGVSRPLLTIQIAGTTTFVHASLSMNSSDNVPDAVSFFYSGDSTREVFLQQETDPLWGALLMFLLPPIGLVMIHILDRWERKRTTSAGSGLSPTPRKGAA